MKKHTGAVIVIAMVLALMGGLSRGADLYWSGAGTWDTTTANWGTGSGGPYNAAAWNNATPDNAIFEGTVGTVTLGEDISLGGLSFTVASTGYTISGNTLNFAPGGSISAINNTVNQTIQSAITGSPTVRVNRGPAGTGYEGLIFAPDSGTQTLGVIYIPDALGGTADKAGVYLSGSTIGNSAASVTFTNGSWRYGTLYKQGSGQWTVGNVDVGTIRINGGTLVANGYIRYYYAGLFVNSGGALHYNNAGAVRSGFTLNGGSFLDNSSGTAITTSTYNPPQTWAGDWTFIGSNGTNSDLNLGAGAVTLATSPTVTVSNALTTLTVGGVITDGLNVYGLTKAGAGTLRLTGNNTYNGNTTVSAGTLSLGRACLDDNAAVSVAAGATLNLNFAGADTVLMLFLGGSRSLAGKWGRVGAIAELGADFESDLLTGDGLLNNLGGLAPAGTWYWDGPNTGGDGDGFSDGGTGTWSTATANWDQGYTTRKVWNNTTADKAIFGGAAGTVTLGEAITLGSILFSAPAGGYKISGNTLNFGPGGSITQSYPNVVHTIAAAITGSPSVGVADGSGYEGLNFAPTNGSQTLGTCTVPYENGTGDKAGIRLGGTTVGNSAGKVTFAAGNPYGTLWKEGSSTWTVGDVDIGTLRLQSGTLVANGTVSVYYAGFAFTGGTLAGTGTLNVPVTVPAGGTLAPGDPTGTLTAQSVDINGNLAIAIDESRSPNVGALATPGTLDIAGATLEVTVTGRATRPAYVIATYGSLTGTFAAINGVNQNWKIAYDYNSGTAIALEPPLLTGIMLIVR